MASADYSSSAIASINAKGRSARAAAPRFAASLSAAAAATFARNVSVRHAELLRGIEVEEVKEVKEVEEVEDVGDKPPIPEGQLVQGPGMPPGMNAKG